MARVPPTRSVKTHEWTHGSINRELFSKHHVSRASTVDRIIGGLAQSALIIQFWAIRSGGILVDISSSCATFALSSPLRASAFGQPGLRRRLCGGHPGGPDSG